MDAKIALSSDQEIIHKAKKFAEPEHQFVAAHGIPVPADSQRPLQKLEDLPGSAWVNMLAEGEAVYKTKNRSRKSLKREYLKSRK